MPRYTDDDDESFDYGSLPDIQQQQFLYDLIGFTGNAQDFRTTDMFWDVMYNDDYQLDRDSTFTSLCPLTSLTNTEWNLKTFGIGTTSENGMGINDNT